MDPATGGVYLLDTEHWAPRRILDHPTRGVTLGPDGYYTVGNTGRVYRLDAENWRPTQVAETGYHGSHDLRWYDGSFYLVTCTGNQVIRLDRAFRPVDVLKIVEDDGDVCHANCLLQTGGELLLCIFTLSPGRREEKRTSEDWRHNGKILRLDWERRRFEVVYEPLSQPHSLVERNGVLYCCESFTSQIVALSLPEFRKELLTVQKGFVRGLAFTEGNAYVGISETRATGLKQLLNELRGSAVVEMDPETWQPKRRFRIPGTEVYEVLPVA